MTRGLADDTAPSLGEPSLGGPSRGAPCRIEHVTTVAQLETVGRLRWNVFSEAIGYGLAQVPAMREITGFDVCPEANHFIAYVGDEAVGAIRLVLPSATLAEQHGCAIGLPIAIDVGFGAVPGDCVLAELGRSAVSRAHRGGPVIGELMRAAYLMSRAAGITHWTGASLTATDDPADACIIDRLVAHHLSRSPLTDVTGHAAPPDGYLPRRQLFDAAQRTTAANGEFASMPLPRTLKFHLICGAHAAGNVYFDRHICEFLVPIIFDLDDYATSPLGRRYSEASPRITHLSVGETLLARQGIGECRATD